MPDMPVVWTVTVWRLHSSHSVQVGLHRIGVSHPSGPHSQNCIIISRDYPGKDPAVFSAEEVLHEVRVSFCHGSEKIGRRDLLQDTLVWSAVSREDVRKLL